MIGTAADPDLLSSNGQTLTFTPCGIAHSGGKSVASSRDGQGRITAITDLVGNVHRYDYDANGDLKAHTDPEANATGFKYDYRHGLLEIQLVGWDEGRTPTFRFPHRGGCGGSLRSPLGTSFA